MVGRRTFNSVLEVNDDSILVTASSYIKIGIWQVMLKIKDRLTLSK